MQENLFQDISSNRCVYIDRDVTIFSFSVYFSHARESRDVIRL